MFIIFGSRVREVKVGSGQFCCPACGQQTACHRMRVATYFTLYFIPIFPVQVHDEYVKCTGCGEQFDLSVLETATTPVVESRKPWPCPFCTHANPGHIAVCQKCKTRRLPSLD